MSADRVRGWLEIRDPLERQLGALGKAAMATLGPLSGARVLDIGCGIGGTPAALARAVGPRGEVVAIDLLETALEVLRGDTLPANVALLAGDAQTFPFETGTFDAAFSRFGVMVFADPVAAFSNIRRALKPGGRLAFVCWRGLEENEIDALPLRAAARVLPAGTVEAATTADWFSLSRAETIRQALTDAGFIDIEIDARDTPVDCGSLPATVEVCTRVGALGAILRERPDLRGAAADRLTEALRPLDERGGPRLKAATWVVLARR